MRSRDTDDSVSVIYHPSEDEGGASLRLQLFGSSLSLLRVWASAIKRWDEVSTDGGVATKRGLMSRGLPLQAHRTASIFAVI